MTINDPLEPITRETRSWLVDLQHGAPNTNAAMEAAYNLGRRDELRRWVETLNGFENLIDQVRK